MNWQPIETAPKDGSVVLLGGGTFCTTPRNKGELEFREVTAGRWTDEWLDNRYPWRGNPLGYLGGEKYHEPTHWQPLPDPPVLDLAA